MALFGALTLVTLGAGGASAESPRVRGNIASVGGLKVQIYSQMCDNGGPNLHTRLNVKNLSSTTKQVLVHDTYARAVYDPPGPLRPGKATLVHLTSSSRTPSHTLTVAAGGDSVTMTVPESPCPTSTSSSSTSSSSTSTSSTSKPHGSSTSTIVTTPVDPGGGPSNPPVAGPGVVAAGGSVGSSGATAAASTGTLPFTGSDLRTFALIGNLLVLIGFAMLYLSHRSPKTAAFFKRLRPTSNASA